MRLEFRSRERWEVQQEVVSICHEPGVTIMTVFLLLLETKGACHEEGTIGLYNDVHNRRQLAQCENTEQNTMVGFKSREHLSIQVKLFLSRTSVFPISKFSPQNSSFS
jgi:hypothetical protein